MVHRSRGRLFSLGVMLLVGVAGVRAEELVGNGDWNQFRGPTADGRAVSRQLPERWSETEAIRWKAAVPGKAWSSPVVLGNRIWVTNATEDGRRLSVVAIDADSGRVIHDRPVFEIAEPMFCHPYNSYGSPTPVADAGRVWVHFGSAGTACLDAATGQTLWSRQDLLCDHHRGPGSSPILFENLLIMNFDGFDRQYVVALDRDTGRTVWQTDRSIDYGSDNGDFKKAYCTPAVFEHAGRLQLVSPAAVGTVSYDPRTGAELWTVYHGGYNAAARPLYSHGLVVICTAGGDRLLAVRPEGTGNITADAVVWKFGKSAPTRPSQSIVGDHLYMVSDTGIFSCVELTSGEQAWSERRSGRYSASLVESAGRLYAFDEDGGCVVFRADPRAFTLVAENSLADGCMASPAVVGDDLIVRTKTHLYRIGGG
jgi:outer membrane protein assembly factor BamB